jgi:hypothetical protein
LEKNLFEWMIIFKLGVFHGRFGGGHRVRFLTVKMRSSFADRGLLTIVPNAGTVVQDEDVLDTGFARLFGLFLH